MSRDHEEELSHPSYGQIAFHRRQGNPGRLYGSPLKNHESYVTLSVCKSRFIRDGHSDWHFGGLRGDLIEVDLSAAQFAELLTTMNVGSGVPCTIRYIDGKKVENPPDLESEVEKVKSNFKESLVRFAKSLKTKSDEVSELLKKDKLSKADKEKIQGVLNTVQMEISDRQPWVLTMFQEATEKVVTHAKAEIDAFVTTNVVQAGLRAALGAPPVLEAFDAPALPEKAGE